MLTCVRTTEWSWLTYKTTPGLNPKDAKGFPIVFDLGLACVRSRSSLIQSGLFIVFTPQEVYLYDLMT